MTKWYAAWRSSCSLHEMGSVIKVALPSPIAFLHLRRCSYIGKAAAGITNLRVREVLLCLLS